MTTSENTTPLDYTDEEDTEITGTHKLETADTKPMVTPAPAGSVIAQDDARDMNALQEDEAAPAKPVQSDASYMRKDTQQEIDQRWQEVQSEFVDDPRKSVAHAHQLVSDAVQRIVDTFTEERNALERQWSEGNDVSTEDLRVSLHRYREFFARLLPLQASK
jgi:HD-GYP domain-containing protein (c-di-GMP phosphodiesterase class II)